MQAEVELDSLNGEGGQTHEPDPTTPADRFMDRGAQRTSKLTPAEVGEPASAPWLITEERVGFECVTSEKESTFPDWCIFMLLLRFEDPLPRTAMTIKTMNAKKSTKKTGNIF